MKRIQLNQVGVSSALCELTLTFSSGECIGIVGPNGAGKSTLLRCLAGEIRPSRGEILLDERPLRQLSAQERAQRVSYLPQSVAFPFAYTVAELVGLGGASQESCNRALQLLELTSLAQEPLTHLSGGEQRRAALARVLAQESPALLLDEPLTHLDPRYQQVLLEALRRHCQAGGLVLLVLHDLRLARCWCSRLLLLSEGQLVQEGVPERVLTPETLAATFAVSPEFLV